MAGGGTGGSRLAVYLGRLAAAFGVDMKAVQAGLQSGQLGAKHQAVLAALDLYAAHGFANATGGDGVDLYAQGFRTGGEGGAARQRGDDPLFHLKAPLHERRRAVAGC